ncbi:MAG TPA: DUF397 domain-containing protein [Streptomyces sp.]|nr:DUF397 domain-containing protein [Streptomyces sp.]
MSRLPQLIPSGASWRKSSYSNGSGGECVEIATVQSAALVRDSKNVEGPFLTFSGAGWACFVSAVQHGEFQSRLPGRRW